jgi:hypothetical protein
MPKRSRIFSLRTLMMRGESIRYCWLAEVLGVAFFEEINAADVPETFIEHVPAPYAQHHYVIGHQPEDSNGVVTIITANPLDAMVVDNVSKMLAVPVEMALSTRAAITSVIDVAYEQKNTVIEEVAEELDSQNIDQLADEVGGSEDLLDVVICWMSLTARR